MSAKIIYQSYGKHAVRVSKIKRPRQAAAANELHEFVEVSVNIELDGDFQPSYVARDNSLVVATDTCRNTIYVLAKDDPIETIEDFGTSIARHFLRAYSHISRVQVQLEQHLWHRLPSSSYGFIGTDKEQPTSTIEAHRETGLQITSGIQNLMIAKTTESGFSNFHRDEYRTLPDVDDRILATNAKASWTYKVAPESFAVARQRIRSSMLRTFLDHYSHSVQETLYRMGCAALDAEPTVEAIHLEMPNKHHIQFNLVPFGRTNDNEIFVVTDEPYGFISATVARE